MKVLKKILVIALVIIAILLIVALFVKKDYAVRRSVIIHQPVGAVFDYVKYLKNQDYFSKWAQMDPNMKKSYIGTDGTPGFIATWDSEADSVGKGEQEIIALKENERIDYELRFIEPFESKDHAFMTFHEVAAGQTKVVWGFDGKMKYPMNLMLLCMDMEKMLGTDLQEGLNSLKRILEK